ncbi:MAG TPA: 5-(carboxyamino)imidazole ribonucleotide synthase [Candidatus Limnocylindrales bacterium]|nr:5-(carboxyamino)imidazole ribonucleotide synthase [Candidatus Limnocylindrales bacterium]
MKKRIGIVGGGQLARMMADPANKLGFTLTAIDPTPNSPVGQVAQEITADFNDEKALRKLAKNSDVLTVEIEVVDESGLKKLLEEFNSNNIPVHPSPKTIALVQDKLLQKQFLKKNKIPTPEFVEVTTKKSISDATKKLGYPLVLKARTGAYDGRGNALINNESGIDKALDKLRGRKLYVEKFVPFIKELAVIAARSVKGKIVTYPVVETMHKNNILHYLLSPAPIDKKIALKAKDLAIEVMKHLKGAGVFGIEMFLTKDDNVLINEIAPRVHNSGHHTIEANKTSQFEQHIRAISGMPLGSTDTVTPAAAMINILGDRTGKSSPKGIEDAEKIPGVKVHIYGKLETKPERKMGHITAVADTLDAALENAKQARKLITI